MYHPCQTIRLNTRDPARFTEKMVRLRNCCYYAPRQLKSPLNNINRLDLAVLASEAHLSPNIYLVFG